MRIRTQIDFVGLCFLEPRFGEHIPEVVRTCYENPLVKEDRWAIVHEEGNEGGVLCKVHGWVAAARSFMEVPPSEVLGEAWRQVLQLASAGTNAAEYLVSSL